MNRECGDFNVQGYLQRKGIHIKKISGDELILDCFFCDPPDTKEHLYVNMKTTQFHCFKCNHNGNIFTLMKYFGDERHNSNFNQELLQKIEQEKKVADVLGETVEFYRRSMTDGIRDYLLKRGLTIETMNGYKLGYARGGLRKHLSEQGFPLELCQQAGVIKEDGKDYFYEKIILPYFYRKRVVLIRCRSNPDDAKKSYYPLQDYPIRLFNEDALFNAKDMIICEGELDALMLLQMGFKHVVAIPGAGSFKEEWIVKFLDCRKIYLALDADPSGEKGALRIAKLLGEKARIVQLPAGMDVNDYFLAGHGKEDFEKLLSQAMPRLELLLHQIELLPERDRKEELKSLVPELLCLDVIDLETYMIYIQKRLKIGKGAMKAMLKQQRKITEHLKQETRYDDTAKKHEMNDEERDEALEILQDPDMLTRFLDATEQIKFVGEEENKIMLLFSMTSRLLEHPIDILVKGASSAGKNYQVENVAIFFPDEDVKSFSEITPKSLYHRKDVMAHKVMIMAERNGSEQSDYVIRTMQSEKRLTLSTVVKNPETGKFETEDIEIQGPIAFIETTTKSHIHDENETRSFDIFVDESEKQTKRIQQAKLAKYKGEIIDKDKIARPWKNAQRLLKPYRVYFPFADYITFDTKNVRSRRDQERFLALIEVIAFTHQYQREKKIINGIEFQMASVEDYAIAYGLAEKILFPTTSGISPKLEAFVAELWKMAEKRAETIKTGATAIKMTRKEIEDQLKWGKNTVLKYLGEAEEKDLIAVERPGSGKQNFYQVAKKVADIKMSYLITPQDLKAKCEGSGNPATTAPNPVREVNSFNYNNLMQRDQAVLPGI